MSISVDAVKDLLSYDPNLGEFTWMESRRKKVKRGDKAGFAHDEGYLVITVDGARVRGAEAAWIHMKGCLPPEGFILAHRDGNRLNCAWENIEVVKKSPSWSWEDMIAYDSETGLFSWRYRFGPEGKPLSGRPGWETKQGYIRMASGGKEIQAHRLAHLMMTGNDVPDGMDIDHINGIRSDNRWCNLRVVTRTQNLMNSALRPDNRSGIKGVYWDSRRNLWQAEIKVAGKREHLGRFATIDEAASARRLAEDRLFGEYSYRESRG